MSRRSLGRGPAVPPEHSREIARLLAEAVKRHNEGRLARAAALYARVLALAPDQPDALHLTGLLAHAAGDGDRARALIERAVAAQPRQAAFHNSLGVVRLDAGDARDAADHFARALACDPLYPEAFLNRGNAFQRLNRLADAIASYDEAITLRPDYPEALCNRGRALHLMDRPGDAVDDFERALALRPGYAVAARYLGDSLAVLGRADAARAAYGRALAAAPEDAEALAGLASLEEHVNRLAEAAAAAERALARDPGQVRAALTLARVYRRQGRFADGLARLQPFAGYSSRPAAAGYSDDAAALIAFERAMLHDRAGDYTAAYAAFVEANQRMEHAWPVDAADRAFFPDLVARLTAGFTADWIAAWTPPPVPRADDPPDPIFLVGFPRSGTTLLERMLDAHPALSTLEEKDAIDVLRRCIAEKPGGYPDALARLSTSDLADLRARYWGEVGRHLGGAPPGPLVDKMPLNSIEAGLIHRVFPRARFLLALRHPADVVLSNFMQAFKPNAAMVQFGSLASAARFYAGVMALWRQYRQVLPLSVHTIRYEDLITDVEGETRRILAFLDLRWQSEVLGYRERAKARAIATPSYHQVVEPVYRRAIGRWRNYRPFFGDALPLLAPFIAAFGYDDG